MGVGDGIEGLLCRVSAVEEPQHAVVETLYAYAYAIKEAQPCKSLKVVGREVLWIGLDGQLLHLRQIEASAQPFHNACKMLDRQY